MQSEHGELLYHMEVSWLSCDNRLKRFFALREEIALSVATKDNDVSELGDPTFIANLAFLPDLQDHLNMFNLSFQGPKPVITAMYDCVKFFKCKLSLWSKQLTNSNVAHLKALQSMDKIDAKYLEEHRNVISTLHEEFDRRFKDFDAIEREFKLFSAPEVPKLFVNP